MMKRLFLKLRFLVLISAAAVFIVAAVLALTGIRGNIGKFRLPGARDIGLLYGRMSAGFHYERPAGVSMLDQNGKLIAARVKEAADVTTLPPPTDFNMFGFRYRRTLYAINLPIMAEGPDPHKGRPLTEQELGRVDPLSLTTRREAYFWTVPNWFLLLVTAGILYAGVAGPYRRHRTFRHRQRNNLCLHCGYDLRGSPDRCPECGTFPLTPPAAPLKA